MIIEFEALEPNDKLYIFGDFKIYLLFKNKCILKSNSSHEPKNHCKDFSPEIQKYNELYSVHGFKQLVNCPTRITCNTSTLTDRVLTNAHENIS